MQIVLYIVLHVLHGWTYTLCINLWWLLSESSLEYERAQTSHLYRFRLWSWTSLCFMRSFDLVKVLVHWSHLYGLSTEWMTECLFKSELVRNVLLQTSHMNGLSPECLIRMWRFRLCGNPNSLPQVSQTYEPGSILGNLFVCILEKWEDNASLV